MERLLPILAIVALALGALAAMFISGIGLIAVALYGIVVCVFLFLTRSLVPIAIGAAAALLLVLSALGLLGGISGDGGGVDFGITLAWAHAALAAGIALLAGGVLAAGWDELDPDWVGWVGAGALLVAAVLAAFHRAALGGVMTWGFVVGILLLVAIWPIVLLMLAPSHAPESHAEATS